MNNQPAATNGLVVAGYLTGVLLPIVGFFVGLALIIKNRAGHGVTVMVLSVAIPVLVFAVATSDHGSQAAYDDCLAAHSSESSLTQTVACVKFLP